MPRQGVVAGVEMMVVEKSMGDLVAPQLLRLLGRHRPEDWPDNSSRTVRHLGRSIQSQAFEGNSLLPLTRPGHANQSTKTRVGGDSGEYAKELWCKYLHRSLNDEAEWDDGEVRGLT